MKTLLYIKYASRALLRGGQRTILAIFCVAVGVMAVVSLQLVGFMLQNSLIANARANNGGDIALSTSGVLLTPADLTYFVQLKKKGAITNYTALISNSGALTARAPSLRYFSIYAVDPAAFPLVSHPNFAQPADGSFAKLLAQNQVVVTQGFLDRYHKRVGDTFAVYTHTTAGSGQTLHVKLAGVITNTGMFAQSSNLLLISTRDYLAGVPAAEQNYNSVNITTASQAQTDAAVKTISEHFPLAAAQTASELLKSEQESVDTLNKFLEMTGLLALLIGGVGIVNTMQVLLSRRKIEIAMLKTTGYRRRDLYLLFGLEAGLLGLIGGLLGAIAATVVCVVVFNLLQNLGLNLVFVLNKRLIAGGVAIGCVTALIFGLMPIVQAANIRPLSVIREQEKQSGFKLAFFLVALLSVLFCGLATVILKNDLTLGILATYGALIFLLVLSTCFALVVLLVSKLPVPELFQSRQILLVLIGLLLSIPAFLVLPIFGLGLIGISLLGLLVGFLPRDWKVNIKMALRNLGRRRARTTTTLLALFIGVFSVGLIIALDQDVQTNLKSSLARDTPYNLVATTSGQDSSALHARVNSIPGLLSSREDMLTAVRPVALNGIPLEAALPAPTGRDQDQEQARLQVASLLSQVEGENLNQAPIPLKMSQGRNLSAADLNANAVIIGSQLANSLQPSLTVGNTLTLSSMDGKVSKTVTIIGVVGRSNTYTTLAKILAPSALVNALSVVDAPPQSASTQKATSTPAVSANSGATTIFYMNITPAQMNAALDELGRVVPNASVQDFTDAASTFIQQLNSMLAVLIAVASLSMFAAVIIIANTVALAMLERRRELGILKALGYTSGTVLSGVLIENGIVGAVGAFIAALLAAGGVIIIGKQVFNLTLRMSPLIVVGLIGCSALLAMFIAALVAWGAVRVRPLEVLRYE